MKIVVTCWFAKCLQIMNGNVTEKHVLQKFKKSLIYTIYFIYLDLERKRCYNITNEVSTIYDSDLRVLYFVTFVTEWTKNLLKISKLLLIKAYMGIYDKLFNV